MTLAFGPALKQPDQRCCGACCVVVARLLRAAESAGPTRSLAGFPAEALATHRRLTSAADGLGGLQLPWPRALGTPPWAIARALGILEGVRYRVRLARWTSRDDEIAEAVVDHPVAIYVGSPALPRHVTLAIAAEGDGLRVYDPASGGLVTLARDSFRVAGWSVPWFVVLPR
ncbi:hypothetical protein [Nocardioides sp.]|uniref:hypothetical protein n=1 Tax=Nocardioides sp. TaxID=35761 RepID=UPI0039E70BB3